MSYIKLVMISGLDGNGAYKLVKLVNYFCGVIALFNYIVLF